MSKKQSSRKAISQVIRESIESADVTRYRISKETGIEQSVLSRFICGERGLSMEAIDTLAEFFGLELKPIPMPDNKPKTKTTKRKGTR